MHNALSHVHHPGAVCGVSHAACSDAHSVYDAHRRTLLMCVDCALHDVRPQHIVADGVCLPRMHAANRASRLTRTFATWSTPHYGGTLPEHGPSGLHIPMAEQPAALVERTDLLRFVFPQHIIETPFLVQQVGRVIGTRDTSTATLVGMAVYYPCLRLQNDVMLGKFLADNYRFLYDTRPRNELSPPEQKARRGIAEILLMSSECVGLLAPPQSAADRASQLPWHPPIDTMRYVSIDKTGLYIPTPRPVVEVLLVEPVRQALTGCANWLQQSDPTYASTHIRMCEQGAGTTLERRHARVPLLPPWYQEDGGVCGALLEDLTLDQLIAQCRAMPRNQTFDLVALLRRRSAFLHGGNDALISPASIVTPLHGAPLGNVTHRSRPATMQTSIKDALLAATKPVVTEEMIDADIELLLRECMALRKEISKTSDSELKDTLRKRIRTAEDATLAYEDDRPGTYAMRHPTQPPIRIDVVAESVVAKKASRARTDDDDEMNVCFVEAHEELSELKNQLKKYKRDDPEYKRLHEELVRAEKLIKDVAFCPDEEAADIVSQNRERVRDERKLDREKKKDPNAKLTNHGYLKSKRDNFIASDDDQESSDYEGSESDGSDSDASGGGVRSDDEETVASPSTLKEEVEEEQRAREVEAETRAQVRSGVVQDSDSEDEGQQPTATAASPEVFHRTKASKRKPVVAEMTKVKPAPDVESEDDAEDWSRPNGQPVRRRSPSVVVAASTADARSSGPKSKHSKSKGADVDVATNATASVSVLDEKPAPKPNAKKTPEEKAMHRREADRLRREKKKEDEKRRIAEEQAKQAGAVAVPMVVDAVADDATPVAPKKSSKRKHEDAAADDKTSSKAAKPPIDLAKVRAGVFIASKSATHAQDVERWWQQFDEYAKAVLEKSHARDLSVCHTHAYADATRNSHFLGKCLETDVDADTTRALTEYHVLAKCRFAPEHYCGETLGIDVKIPASKCRATRSFVTCWYYYHGDVAYKLDRKDAWARIHRPPYVPADDVDAV